MSAFVHVPPVLAVLSVPYFDEETVPGSPLNEGALLRYTGMRDIRVISGPRDSRNWENGQEEDMRSEDAEPPCWRESESLVFRWNHPLRYDESAFGMFAQHVQTQEFGSEVSSIFDGSDADFYNSQFFVFDRGVVGAADRAFVGLPGGWTRRLCRIASGSGEDERSGTAPGERSGTAPKNGALRSSEDNWLRRSIRVTQHFALTAAKQLADLMQTFGAEFFGRGIELVLQQSWCLGIVYPQT